MSTAIPSNSVSKKSFTVYDVVPDGDYPARIVRFIGLGVQKQQPYKGEEKSPAFKCSLAYELIDVDATGREYQGEDDEEGKPIDPRPSCQFQDMFLFPGAKRGNVYDLCRCVDPSIQEVPRTLEWFMDKLGEIVNVRVGHYINKRGEKRNKVVSVSSIPNMFRKQVGEARCEMVAFNPYVDTPEMMQAYSKVYKFQRDLLAEAFDAKNIPFAGKEPISDDDQKPTGDNNNKPSMSKPSADNEPSMDFDDDVPF